MSRMFRAEEVIGGRFQIYQETKTFPMVFLVCYDSETKEMVLLRSISDKYMGSSDAKKRFIRFAEGWLALGAHKNIVSARSVVHIKGKPYLLTDYTPRLCTISEYILPEVVWQRLPITKALRIALDICNGMEWVSHTARSSGQAFPYGNLCDRSILITDDEVAKMTDFGLVQLLRDLGVKMRTFALLTKDGAWGVPEYMSPEQWLGKGDIDVRSDIYSFGCLLYLLLTGRRPFSRDTIDKCRGAHLTLTPPNPRHLNPDVPEELASAVLKCLEKRPQDRYEGFKCLREDLVKVFETISGESVPEETAEEVTAWEMATKAHGLVLFEKYGEANEWCDKALALSPTCCRAWEVKAELRSEMGDKQEALVCLDKALESKARVGSLLCSKGLIFMEINDFKNALGCFERVIVTEPENVNAKIGKCLCLNGLGEFEKTIEWGKQLIENTHLNLFELFMIWRALGEAYWKMGNREEAIRCYDRAFDCWPLDPGPLVEKGFLLAEVGRHEEALECFATATNRAAKHAIAWLGKGLVSAYLNKLEDAVEAFEKALECNPKLAEQWAREAQEKMDSQSFALWQARAKALQSAGKSEEASVCIEKGLELNPWDAELWKLRARTYRGSDSKQVSSITIKRQN